MPKKNNQRGGTGATVEILKDILIVQLAVAGVPQTTIRDLVGCNIVRVNRIAKHLRKNKADRD